MSDYNFQAIDADYDYLNELAKKNNIKYTNWAMDTIDFSKPHGFTAKWIFREKGGFPLKGDTWLDVWKSIDDAFAATGGHRDHCFIEGIYQKEDGKAIHVHFGS